MGVLDTEIVVEGVGVLVTETVVDGVGELDGVPLLERVGVLEGVCVGVLDRDGLGVGEQDTCCRIEFRVKRQS